MEITKINMERKMKHGDINGVEVKEGDKVTRAKKHGVDREFKDHNREFEVEHLESTSIQLKGVDSWFATDHFRKVVDKVGRKSLLEVKRTYWVLGSKLSLEAVKDLYSDLEKALGAMEK